MSVNMVRHFPALIGPVIIRLAERLGSRSINRAINIAICATG